MEILQSISKYFVLILLKFCNENTGKTNKSRKNCKTQPKVSSAKRSSQRRYQRRKLDNFIIFIANLAARERR